MRMTWKGVTTITLSAMGMLCIGSVFAQSDITITSYNNDYTQHVASRQAGYASGGLFDNLLGLQIKNISAHTVSLPTLTVFVDDAKGCAIDTDEYGNYLVPEFVYLYGWTTKYDKQFDKNGYSNVYFTKNAVMSGKNAIIYTFFTPLEIPAGETRKIQVVGKLCNDKMGSLNGYYATDTSFDTVAQDSSSHRIYGPTIMLTERVVSKDDGSLDVDVRDLFFTPNDPQSQVEGVKGYAIPTPLVIGVYMSPGILAESTMQAYSWYTVGGKKTLVYRQVIITKLDTQTDAQKAFTTNPYQCTSAKDCLIIHTPDSDGNQRYCYLFKTPLVGKVYGMICDVLYKNLWIKINVEQAVDLKKGIKSMEDVYEFIAKPILAKLYEANGATYKAQLTATENKLVASTQKSIDTASGNQKATLIAKLTAQLKTEKNARKKMVLEKILQKYK